MTIPRLSDIIGILNRMAPPWMAESWDNAGLQVGDPPAQVDRIMVALDAAGDTIADAARHGCQLLVTHHPLIFKPLKRISTSDPAGAAVASAIRHGIAVFSAHTNYDIATDGVNDILARVAGIADPKPLQVTQREELVKLVVFVPSGHEEKVMGALFPFSGFIGRYRDCSFRVEGRGTFTPQEGATPFAGVVGRREEVTEARLEVLVRRDQANAAVAAMIKAHPYEEPAFDLVHLINTGSEWGLGRIGELPAAITVEEFARSVKKGLGAGGVRIVGEPGRAVKRVALCSGSGMSLMREAARRGADLLLTGDVKYHEAREALDLGIAVVDAGHFATEAVMIAATAGRLRTELEKRRFDAVVIECGAETDPFIFL